MATSKTGPLESEEADLVETLRDSGLLSAEDLRRAQLLADERGMPLAQSVIALGLLTEDQVLWFAAERAGVELVFPTEDGVDRELVARFPAELLLKHDALPLLEEQQEVVVAFPAAPSPEAIEAFAQAIGKPVRPALASAPRLRRVLGRLLPSGSGDAERASARDPSGVTAFYRHLTSAFGAGAEELRFEPGPVDVRVRCRVRGRLQEMAREPSALGPAIAARARMFAGVEPAVVPCVRRAASRTSLGGRPTRLALSIVPSRHGECVVLRALAPVDIPARLADWPLPRELAEWLASPPQAAPRGRRAVVVRSDDDEVRVALLRSIATHADDSGLAVFWIGPEGEAPSGSWIVVDDGDLIDAVLGARPDVVVVDGVSAVPGPLADILGASRADAADASPAMAVVDVRVERRGKAALGTIVVESRFASGAAGVEGRS